jgi:hypothetical protein
MGPQELFLAKALYDNMAETPDELAFRRGDVLTVLEQDTGGLLGWWLCSLRGRQGIAPGNRLTILTGMLDSGANRSSAASSRSSGELVDNDDDGPVWQTHLEQSLKVRGWQFFSLYISFRVRI